MIMFKDGEVPKNLKDKDEDDDDDDDDDDEEEKDNMSEVLYALGFREGDNPTLDQVTKTIRGLRAENVQSFREQDDYAERLEALEQRERVSKYREQTEGLTGIEGTPEQLAEKLADIEKKFGTEEASSLLKTYREASDLQPATKRKLSPGSAAMNFNTAVEKYMEKHPDVSRSDALVAVGKENPTLYREYRAS